ncbi:4Fe-4S dicluster domain-containing protein [Clostridium magnum]|uniref:NAD(P)H-quinone oxidoreductase subunit I, chloroplastic n=1 Tax=Clostridium magnum DSM 2767 TaxID=1121326 RepID=A0A162RGF7_9CLOT|nr:4Fe-4S dicluster domain-containing protein [Clostridium magnum]KZL89867.1 NAD(P)H-quinone oxidoreductase subunit I, chloroplastic [Clostridium magnum DSM 2767]SHI47515.1 2-oxoglutarate ferredoxin oxidoreductase subunit delta [Clostridium magnum DSM 2767]
MPKVSFREDRCKGCGLCITVCPKKIINFVDKLNAKGYHSANVPVNKMEECVGCAACGRICPDCVITVEKE